MTATCSCFPVPDPWAHMGAVEPGGALEPNPQCPIHFPASVLERVTEILRATDRGSSRLTPDYAAMAQALAAAGLLIPDPAVCNVCDGTGSDCRPDPLHTGFWYCSSPPPCPISATRRMAAECGPALARLEQIARGASQ